MVAIEFICLVRFSNKRIVSKTDKPLSQQPLKKYIYKDNYDIILVSKIFVISCTKQLQQINRQILILI